MFNFYKRQTKKLKRFIYKEFGVNVDVDLDETLLELCTRVAMISENCTKEELKNKWIFNEQLDIPVWICNIIMIALFPKTDPTLKIKNIIDGVKNVNTRISN